MALPKRWEPYSPIGQQIEGTRFVSFKVPLNENLNGKVSEELRFSPDQLVKMIADRGQSLGLVIDLTNTTRYYDKQELIKNGILYRKIFTEGKRVPSKIVVDQFFAAVDSFLADNQEPDVLIGVHCTHGVNRTGYLVCRYMVEKMSVNPDEAIKAFIDARGHPIEREIYIKDLQLRENGGSGLPEKESICDDWREKNTRYRNNHGNVPWQDDRRSHRRDHYSPSSTFRGDSHEGNKDPPRRSFHRQDYAWNRPRPYYHRQFRDRYENYGFGSFDRQNGHQNFGAQNAFGHYPGLNAEGYYEFDEQSSYGCGYTSFNGYADPNYSGHSERSYDHRHSYHDYRQNGNHGNKRGSNHWRRH